MKNIILLLLIFVSLISTPCFGADYYVKTGGNDSSDGLSDGNAWATVAKVNASTFNPGDNIYFNRGNSWSETMVFPSSGTFGNPITITAYGTGARPIINGDTTSANSLLTTDKDYLVFRSLNIVGSHTTDDEQVSKSVLVNGCANSVIFDDMDLDYLLDKKTRNFSFVNCSGTLMNSDVDGGVYGVHISVNNGGSYHPKIINNNIHDQDDGTFSDWDGIKCGVSSGDMNGLLIQGNNIHGFNEDGIDFISCKGNPIYIKDNNIHHPGDRYTAGGKNINGIKIVKDDFSTGSVYYIEGNNIHDLAVNDVGVCITGGDGNESHIKNNICYGFGTQGFFLREFINSTVYNNTIIDTFPATGAALDFFANTGTDVRNNILKSINVYDFQVRGASAITGDYNLLVDDASANVLDTSSYTGGDNDLYETDPLLNANYSIPTNSPAKDAGETLPEVTHDIRGYPRPGGAGYDIGAFEFGSLMKFQGVTLQ